MQPALSDRLGGMHAKWAVEFSRMPAAKSVSSRGGAIFPFDCSEFDVHARMELKNTLLQSNLSKFNQPNIAKHFHAFTLQCAFIAVQNAPNDRVSPIQLSAWNH